MTEPRDPRPFDAVDAQLTSAYRGTVAWLSGGRGFIGERLAAALAAHGAQVAFFDGDVRDARDVRESVLAARPARLFHLAAPVDVSRDPALEPLMQDVIVGGGARVLDALVAASTGVAPENQPLLIQVGTCEEYGTIDAPFAEQDEPSDPVSPYAAAKLEATRQALARAQELSLRVVVARPFLTYGPGQGERQLVPAAISAALARHDFPMTAGLQTRELNHVDDTALGLLRAGASPAAEGAIVNVGSGHEHRVVDVARMIFELAGADPSLLRPGALPTRSGEVSRFFADVTRCRAWLGHEPLYDLEQGLRQVIAARRSAGGSA